MDKRKFIGILILGGLVLLVMLATFFSKDVFYSKYETNQRQVISKTLNIISNQISVFQEKQRFDTPAEAQIDKMQSDGYKIEMTSDQKSFQIWATPIEYGKSGKMSYYSDSNDGDIHGADHQGGKASANDPIVQKILEESKELLKKNKEQK